MSEDEESDLTEKLVGIALKEGVPIVADIVTSKILGLDDEGSPIRYGTVRNVKLIKPTGNPTDESDDDDLFIDDEVVERTEDLSVGEISNSFDSLTIGEMRELMKELPEHVIHRDRRTSPYHQYLKDCLVGPRDSDVPMDEHIRSCNLSWRELPEEKKDTYRELARIENREDD